MKKCELCNKVARMYCESDEASLCWTCDLRVHTANFLVAKHTRTLLCHACQSPTPWTGSGPRLGPTVSVCEACANGRRDGAAEDEDDEDSDSENQVVPLSLPPSFASTSSAKAKR
ncbi:B-box zinc finger protein 32-like [Salvia divinorum]|uniref:B-box zinc finger protein 32-like n=1 Tax=Salvia divinorum TaxID=28513 RepID=A0ABD1G024_SALDI